ncbi:MAG TPA: hypothetical protein VLJ37_05700, partial [bacterium]|nr:hypothetical protein [bacterium]
MVKASLKLPNGTLVQIEGTDQEVRDLLQFYGGEAVHRRAAAIKTTTRPNAVKITKLADEPRSITPNLSEIVNLAKNCDGAENIESQILDRASQVDRTLLPLYIVHEHLGNAFGLSSGEINKITTELGVPVSQPNASITLS